ncbi:MAG: ADP-glyceromanno-heptose 6-epimerase [Exilispira sp.]
MIIVTGGAGFIGSNLVYKLNLKGISDILIVDNLTNSLKQRNLNALKFLDFIDKDEFKEKIKKIKKIEIIFHQGACSDTMETDGKYMMKNNYEYSKIILNHCIENKIRLIYASSASVYGNGLNGFKEEREREYPLNIYAFSKYIFDNYVRRFLAGLEKNKKTRKIHRQIAGLRYFNVYGPQENHKNRMASTIFHFYNQIKSEKKIKLFEGSENFLRDFVYVDDICEINIFFLNNPDKSGIFNCGSGKAESFLKIAQILKSIYSYAEIEFIPFPKQLKGKYQTYTCADLTKLNEIGYKKSFTSLEEGIKKYLHYLEKNDGYLTKG